MLFRSITVLAFLFAGNLLAQAQTIDRMLAIVDGNVITHGDLQRYRRLAGMFGFADEVPADDRAALESLIDDRLIDAQVQQFPVIRVADAEVRALVSEIAPAGDPLLTLELISTAARDRLERAQYFDIRFGQFVSASDEEVQEYYETVFLPQARERGLAPIPPLEAVAGKIRQNVLVEQTNRDIMTWLESLRRRSEIEIVE